MGNAIQLLRALKKQGRSVAGGGEWQWGMRGARIPLGGEMYNVPMRPPSSSSDDGTFAGPLGMRKMVLYLTLDTI